MTDWADERAQEFARSHGGPIASQRPIIICDDASLAALLREVDKEAKQIILDDCEKEWDLAEKDWKAEVRRVVEGVKGDTHTTLDGGHWACDEILARLEKL
jgi:hypothetical protein